jgi:hypothetical protein
MSGPITTVLDEHNQPKAPAAANRSLERGGCRKAVEAAMSFKETIK